MREDISALPQALSESHKRTGSPTSIQALSSNLLTAYLPAVSERKLRMMRASVTAFAKSIK